ncbi:MAG: hypothetical protein V2A71_06920, partial [Candidatus Eisenbacteria bacterium]
MKVMRIFGACRTIGNAFLECLLPHHCLVCQKGAAAIDRVCPSCLTLLEPQPVLFCPGCRYEGISDRGLCQSPGHGQVSALAALPAGQAVLTLIHRFKYSRERELALFLAQLVLRSGIVDERLAGYDLMCPVPLHRVRERERGFNQSTE